MGWRMLMLCPQGTPTFIARDVVSGGQKEGDYKLNPMPQLNQANEAYKDAVPERLMAFPPNEGEFYSIGRDKPREPFKHRLQYDAESVFWLLLWWAILACPGGSSPDENEIQEKHWVALAGEQDEKWDPREHFIRNSLKGVFHPTYEPLQKLLQDMAKQLRGDHKQSKDEPRQQPDYLHEAFQRLIIEFLFDSYGKPFMVQQKGPKSRKAP